MKKLTMKQIETGTGGRILCGDENLMVEKICTDSRKAEKGDLFFALIGDNHDAHKYFSY